MKKPLLIYGAGGLGREILSLVRTSEVWEPVGFLDDAVPTNQVIRGVPVLGGIEALLSFDGPRNIVVAVGQPAIKQEIVRVLKSHNVHYPILIHPAAILQDPESITLGEGSYHRRGLHIDHRYIRGESCPDKPELDDRP